MRNGHPILLVEDNETDVINLQRALKKQNIHKELVSVGNGEEAWNYLQRTLNEDLSRLPNLILLDLNMPLMNGFELLEHLTQEPQLHKIPVVVFTSSDQIRDMDKCFTSKVAGYFVKPGDYSLYSDFIKTLDQYWSSSHLPELA